jgi:uncharacterized protein (DUF934 family)
MPLIKDGIVTDDPYLQILDEAPLPEGVPVLLPAQRFLADAQDLTQGLTQSLADRPGKIGVIWPNHRDVAELAPWLDRLSLVALVFPTFKDGRAYSQARTLRERYRFRGELRATGDVLRDQFLFLHRVGFDAYQVKKPADARSILDALHRYSVFYQPAGDGVAGALWRRTSHTQTSRKTANELAL